MLFAIVEKKKNSVDIFSIINTPVEEQPKRRGKKNEERRGENSGKRLRSTDTNREGEKKKTRNISW